MAAGGEARWIGQPVRRLEDQRLLTGQGRFADDLKVPGALQAVVLRSPHAHARILAIDTAAALALPGVRAVFTAADLAATGVGAIPYFNRLAGPDGLPAAAPCLGLAEAVVRHVGEPVALIVAETLAQARDAAEAVAVDYEPLPVVVGARDAVQPGAPQLSRQAPGNVVGHYEVGDAAAVEAILAGAPHVIRLAVDNNRIVVFPLEPRSALATCEGGKLTLFCSSQATHLSRQLLAQALNLPAEALDLVTGDVGGGFGAKIVPYREDLLLLFAARALGRPVRWQGERAEAFLSDTQGRDHEAEVALALDGEGRILAYQSKVLANMGAYLSPFGLPIATTTGHRILCGVYNVPALHLSVKAVLTNSVPTGPYRGAGRPEAIHRLERLLDVAARRLGLDAAEIRRRNLIRPAQLPYRNAAGWTYDSGDFPALLERALARADWSGFPLRRAASAARGLLRGRGLACHIDTTSGIDPAETATATLETDGGVTLASGTQGIGQGLATSYAQILAEQLGLAPAAITVVQGDTRRVAGGGGTYGSRSLHLGGSAVLAAGKALRAKLLALAAARLEAPAEDLRLAEGLVTVAGRNRSLRLADLAAEGSIAASETLEAPYCFPNGCYVAEAEVDPETGLARVVRLTALDDVGRVVNPMIVAGQVHGGLAQGIGQALLEHARYDAASGQLLAGSPLDYALPRADELPSFDVAHDESWPTPTNPLGAKGAGESGAVGAPPAVVAAVLDALGPVGPDHLDMPLTAEKIWRALQRRVA